MAFPVTTGGVDLDQTAFVLHARLAVGVALLVIVLLREQKRSLQGLRATRLDLDQGSFRARRQRCRNHRAQLGRRPWRSKLRNGGSTSFSLDPAHGRTSGAA